MLVCLCYVYGSSKKTLVEGGPQPLLLKNCSSPKGPTRGSFGSEHALSYKDEAIAEPSVISSLDLLGRCTVQEWIFQAKEK